MKDILLQLLSQEIERYDRMVDESEFPIDQTIYNSVAHALRNVKARFNARLQDISKDSGRTGVA